MFYLHCCSARLAGFDFHSVVAGNGSVFGARHQDYLSPAVGHVPGCEVPCFGGVVRLAELEARADRVHLRGHASACPHAPPRGQGLRHPRRVRRPEEPAGVTAVVRRSAPLPLNSTYTPLQLLRRPLRQRHRLRLPVPRLQRRRRPQPGFQLRHPPPPLLRRSRPILHRDRQRDRDLQPGHRRGRRGRLWRAAPGAQVMLPREGARVDGPGTGFAGQPRNGRCGGSFPVQGDPAIQHFRGIELVFVVGGHLHCLLPRIAARSRGHHELQVVRSLHS